MSQSPTEPALAELFDALGAVPNLHGAACTGHRALFDACLTRAAGPTTYARAIEVCAGCPVLAVCAAWVSDLPPNRRPYGVTGGKFRGQRSA